jgi:hypothetical protein
MKKTQNLNVKKHEYHKYNEQKKILFVKRKYPRNNNIKNHTQTHTHLLSNLSCNAHQFRITNTNFLSQNINDEK